MGELIDRHHKIKDAMKKKKYVTGQIITTKEIKVAVQAIHPDIPEGSILPSDFCKNHQNKDPFSGKNHILKKVKRGLYEVL